MSEKAKERDEEITRDIWWLKEELRIQKARVATLEKQLFAFTDKLNERVSKLEAEME